MRGGVSVPPRRTNRYLPRLSRSLLAGVTTFYVSCSVGGPPLGVPPLLHPFWSTWSGWSPGIPCEQQWSFGHFCTFGIFFYTWGSLEILGSLEIVVWQARSLCGNFGMDRGNGGGDMSRAKCDGQTD